jgi:Rha family phage regulatory protein
MNDLVSLGKDGRITVTSKDIAEKFGKTHFNAIRDIERLDCSDEFRALNFEASSYISKQNKRLECFDMTRDGFVFLAMGFTGKEAAKWKEAYINAFNEMERILKEEYKEENKSVMQKCNELISTLKSEKEIASGCGKTLSEWKKVKKQRKEEIENLYKEAQLTLGW